MNSHPNANMPSNTNNLPSNSHDSAMNLSATINQMIDDTLNSSANHRQESNPSHTNHQIHHSHSDQQSFNSSHHLTNEKEADERVRYQSEQNGAMDDSEHHPVSHSPEPIVRQIEPVRSSEPSNISQSTKPRRSKQFDDDDYIPGPKKTPKKVSHPYQPVPDLSQTYFKPVPGLNLTSILPRPLLTDPKLD